MTLAWTAAPVAYRDVMTIEAALDVPEALAWVLVRRGLSDPEAAREFIAADGPLDPPDAMEGVVPAAERLAHAIGRRERVVVHGDYDCDGITSTAILTQALRARGADVGTFLPSRFLDGYGVTTATVERLADEGCRLLVCVDCGTTAVEALTRAWELGIETIVIDHHLAAGVRVPGILANPALGRGRDPLPAAAGVAFKVVQALSSIVDGDRLVSPPEASLDLVALATVADAVPLRGENRRLVAQGLRVMREGGRPGLVALCRAAGGAIAGASARTLGFTLAPAINAAGRLDHPDRALELLLADGVARAQPIADALWALNEERRGVERTITAEAIEAVESRERDGETVAALVVSRAGWHEGVVGIVASRLVERFGRPALVLSELPDGIAKGSGRSLPGVDLHALVGAASGRLSRWGGHQGAVGVQLGTADVAAFARDLALAAEPVRDAIARARIRTVDAVVSGRDLDLRTAEAFEVLAPFGRGNPEVALLLPASRIDPLGTVGSGHRTMRLRNAGVHARAIQFARTGVVPSPDPDARHDAVIQLGLQRWQDVVGPNVVVRDVAPVAVGRDALPGACAAACDVRCPAVVDIAAIRDSIADPWRRAARPPATGAPTVRDRRGRGEAISLLTALAAADGGVIGVVSDTARRRSLLDTLVDARAIGGEALLLAGARCQRDEVPGRSVAGRGGRIVGLVEYDALPDVAPHLADVHVLVVDPPADADAWTWVLHAGRDGLVHLAWGEDERAFAERSAESRHDVRGAAVAIWRALSDGEPRPWGAPLRSALLGDEAIARHPAAVALGVAALASIGRLDISDAGLRANVEAPALSLDTSPIAEAAAARLSDEIAYLRAIGTAVGEPVPAVPVDPGAIVSA